MYKRSDRGGVANRAVAVRGGGEGVGGLHAGEERGAFPLTPSSTGANTVFPSSSCLDHCKPVPGSVNASFPKPSW